MGIPVFQLLAGVGLAALIGWAAWRAGSLAPSGGWAAMLIGGLIFGLGGLPWAVLLLTFFITSSGLSKMFSARKRDLAEKFEKGSQRDWMQVLANSGFGALLVIVQTLYPDALWPWLAYAGVMATVNADTWATELGVLSKAQPVMVTTFQPVARGTSGGITWGGTFASLAGALLIGLFAGLLHPRLPLPAALLMVGLAGVLGALFDSLLGATVQAIYYDPQRDKETERVILDVDGARVTPLRGLPWMNNDMVNFLASIVGAGTAVLLLALLP